jgi:hypothetical protein
MKTRLLLPLLLFFVIPTTGQVEHAPTPEQCRADAKGWGLPSPDLSTNPFLSDKDEVVDYATVVAGDPNLNAKMLETRNAELSQCIKTDTGFFNMRAQYIEANRAYTIAELMRMEHFMQRHRLISQFYVEDEQGKH